MLPLIPILNFNFRCFLVIVVILQFYPGFIKVANKCVPELNSNRTQLYQSKKELKATLYSIGEGVITTDINGIVTHLNPVAEQITGWKEHEALGISIGQFSSW